jgi:hypothetical protein
MLFRQTTCNPIAPQLLDDREREADVHLAAWHWHGRAGLCSLPVCCSRKHQRRRRDEEEQKEGWSHGSDETSKGGESVVGGQDSASG